MVEQDDRLILIALSILRAASSTGQELSGRLSTRKTVGRAVIWDDPPSSPESAMDPRHSLVDPSISSARRS